MRKYSLFLLVFTSISFCGLSAGLTPEQLVDLKTVEEIVISPDGNSLAYTLRVPRKEDADPGPRETELWVVSVDSREPIKFVSGSASLSTPQWSPDGQMITFLDTRESHSDSGQIFAIPVAGGEARPLTKHETTVADYAWSPDGTSIAFLAPDPDSKEVKEAKKKGKDWIIYNEDYNHRRLWVLNVAGEETRKVYDLPLTAWSFTWAGNDSLIFYGTETALTDDSFMFQKIYRVPADGSAAPEVVVATEGKLGEMAVAADGSQLAFLGATSLNDPLAQSLFVVSLEGGRARNLTPQLAATGVHVAWLDAQSLLLVSVKGTENILHRVGLDGSLQEIVWSGLIISGLDVAPNIDRMAVAGHSPLHPAEAFLASLDGKLLQRFSYSNPWLKDVDLGHQELIEWEAPDGRSIQGVINYPQGYQEGQRYPLILQIHGGPEGVSTNGWVSRPAYPVQVLAANGYMVLQPNYRGSGGRGVEFSKADHDDLGGAEFEDVLAGIRYLDEKGMIDPSKVGTGGWSYGGYFSAWGATRYSQFFKAAVVGAGIANWISFTGTTDIPYEMSLVHWNSWWFEKPELHWTRSPLAHLENAATPTLVVHGLEDERVHPEQSLELFNNLRIKGVETRLILYPREPHGLRERAHELHFINSTLEWFDRHVKDGGDTTSDGMEK